MDDQDMSARQGHSQVSCVGLDVQGDEAKLKKLLSTSGRVLANIVDENRRRCHSYLQAYLLYCTANLQLKTCTHPIFSKASLCVCSGLHFVAATGNVPCTKMFCQAGADLNLGDKEGEQIALLQSTPTATSNLSLSHEQLPSLSCQAAVETSLVAPHSLQVFTSTPCIF